MRELAVTRMRYGYRKIRVLLKREGFRHSTKVIYQIYREEGLGLRYRPGRRSKAQITRHNENPRYVPARDGVWTSSLTSLLAGHDFAA